jgi:hypothetical protein
MPKGIVRSNSQANKVNPRKSTRNLGFRRKKRQTNSAEA